MAANAVTIAPADEDYLELVRRFPLRKIEDGAINDAAIEIVANLCARESRGAKLTKGESDYVDALVLLIEAFEEKAYPMGDVTPAQSLAHLIEARGLTQQQVADGAGMPLSTLNEILKGRRRMGTQHIQKLAPFFKVSPTTFL